MKILTVLWLVWTWDLFSFDHNTVIDGAMTQLGFIQIIEQDLLNQVKLFSKYSASFLKGKNTVFNCEIFPKFSQEFWGIFSKIH